MSDFITSVTGPLDKQACIYFFAWTMLFFVILVVTFIAEIFILFKDFKHLTRQNVISGILILFNVFLAYFVNRLLYTMCNKSLA
jgi:uncharacterized membrane protein YbhN (UPF0104 family)